MPITFLSLKLGFNDVFDLVGTIGNCGIKTITNLRTCIIWYIIDMIGCTLYNIIVVLPVFAILMITGFNLQPYVDTINYYLEYIDSIIFDFTCCHLIHFPKWVIDLCYTCKYQDKVDQIKLDWTETIPNLLTEPKNKFYEAGTKFRSVFDSKPK